MDSTTSRRDERGMATAEYAVGTLGAVCIGCVLFQLASQDPSWITGIVERIGDLVDRIGFLGRPRQGLM